ncbi:Phosphoserine phosphatase / D-3-phosphoglycerate dehydrogenase [hydrothermal vent metagenome]|uniref:phosphoserine phosphatase n=1 Tax=hydrothermal vent metagenome TaxID=652676 RepID=A0A3B1DFZ9_9ZZZZ
MFGNIIFIFDFDSTFTQVEALDVLAEISINGSNKEERLAAIAELTNKGMNGQISFSKSLKERMKLISGNRNDLEQLIAKLKKKISTSILPHKDFFINNKKSIYIISSGFKDFIDPVVADFGIDSNHVFANTFTWTKEGQINGFDNKNVLSQNQGKPTLVQQLNFQSPVVVIGDGYTDYEIKKAGFADRFIAYTENISRPLVTAQADFVATNFNDFLNYITNDRSLISKA